MSNLKKIPIAQTTLSNDFTDNYKSEVDSAYQNSHTHSNKTALDNVSGTNTGDQNLSGLANTSLSNIATAGKSVVSNLAMPSNEYIDLTLGAIGTTYTAPADGYYVFWVVMSTNQGTIGLFNNTTGFPVVGGRVPTGNGLSVFIPCRKNDVITTYYDTLSSVQQFRFYYAEGSKP